jgi:FkbM family methyltransferase
MSLRKELLTSKQKTLVIESDNPTIIEHFNNPNNYADVIISQINNERMYDQMFKDETDLVILDFGGNVGLFTLYAQDAAKAIYPVEPTPAHFEILKELTKDYPNVHPVNLAVHNENTEIDFYINPENSTMNSSKNQYGIKTPVQARTVATIMDELGLDHVDFVKCDIEGSEMNALTEQTVGSVVDRIDNWFLEIHATEDDHLASLKANKEKIKTIFEKVGYTVEYTDRHDCIYAYNSKQFAE